jgi:nonribosomal peptide synthetase DhbF
MSTARRFTLADTEQSVAERFEQQVRLHGDRDAVVDGARTWSYEELNRRANRIARALLRTTGLTPTRVGIYADKGADYLACILAVLKAGHAYVPLDPSFPQERNRHILDDVAAPVVLTQSRYVVAAGQWVGASTTVLDVEQLTAEPGDERDLGLHISPDALAYVIYTSGSTGRPKGVMQNQRNLLHGCMRRSHLQGINAQDRMTLFYSCSVMGSVYCIFGALLNGAAILPFDIREAGLIDLARWLIDRRVTVYHSVASVFRQFANTFEGSMLGASVRLVIFGGERVFVSDIAAARRVFSPQVCFFTGLGSTETGTIRHLMITPQTDLQSRLVPIGYPVEGVDVLLRAEDGSILGEAQVGEILVRSRYVALGYWNDEEATRRCFRLVDPANGVREYRMGDLAEMMPGGLLEHRGRKDFQVKIRGFRVEVGEVDAALQSHPALREAAVKAMELGSDMQLVGYVVRREAAAEAPALSARDLREFLRGKLPPHMVPAVFVDMPTLPRTPNGKINALALPEPLPHNQLQDVPPQPPSTETQHQLLAIVTEVLGRPIDGVNRNFFDLGGDSLNATRLLSRIDALMRIRLSMRDIFSATQLAQLAETIDRKRQLGTETASLAAGAWVASDVTRAPATPSQRRMWLSEQLNPGTPAYNISNTVRLRGALNLGALERALGELIERHGSLRTTFLLEGDTLVQVERPTQAFGLRCTTVELSDSETQEQLISAWVEAQAARAFDLVLGPLFDFQLLAVAPQDHVLSLTFSHLIYDNIWSSQVFFRELHELYACHGEAPSPGAGLTRLTYRFLDYALWERNRVAAGRNDASLAYWRRQLADLGGVELPTDRPRPSRMTQRGGLVRFEVPRATRQALQAACRQHSTTTFMALLALWQLLLHRYSGQNDIAVGTPTGRRYRPETEGMVGLFINTLVLRSRFRDGMSFSDLLGQVRQTALDAFEQDELPFESLVSELSPARESGSSPFFRHFFIHRNAVQSTWSLPGLEVQALQCHPGTSKFDLTLSVMETEERLTASLEYSSDLFDHSTVERMAGHYQTLLKSALMEPDLPMMALPMVTAPEHRELVEELNATQQNMPYAEGTLGMFGDWVIRQPDALAVVAHDGSLTYRELDTLAERLAAQLKARGVQRGDRVAVCLQRSCRLPAALLAVWKLAAAYVPLDPDYPAARLMTMLEEANVTVVLSESALLERLGSPDAAKTLCLDSAVDAQPADDVALPVRVQPDADDLAYVIFTSGSTGRPKGVQVTHRGLTNFLCAMRSVPGLAREDVLQTVTTVCFDIAALELFLPLVTGARMVIGPRELSLSPQAMVRSLAQHGATIMQATPVTWRMLLDHGWSGRPGFKILCGGEAMGADLADRLLATGCEIWNLYGPTETTIWSSAGQVLTRDDARHIGKPIANTQLLVTNAALAVQPVGVPGELVIGGDGLAAGYLGRPDLTGERFVECALGSTGRVYRTGDLAVRRMDGRIEFLGRSDHQVKIRGFRVELGDVEAHLVAQPAVRQALVVARDDGSGGKCLVAYLTLNEAHALDCADLHARLKAALPHYMVPSAFVALPAFPLTPNGKIDRARLPAPGLSSEQPTAGPHAGPRDDLDRSFLDVWGRLLQRPQLGLDDDFFACGGDSMMAIRLVTELKRATGMDFPLSAVFESPTIRQLIARAGDRAERAASVVRLNDAQSGTPIYCLAGVMLYKGLAQRLPNNPVLGVYAQREWSGHAEGGPAQTLRVPLDELVDNYADAVERHASSRMIALAGLSFGGLMALEVAAELGRRGFVVSHVAMFDTTPASAYVKSTRKWAADLAKRCVQGRWLAGASAGLKRVLEKRPTGLHPASSHRDQTDVPCERLARRQAYRALGAEFDLQNKRYLVNVLLFKATQKPLGLGLTLKPDHGFGAVIAGSLSLCDIDADHLGILLDETAVNEVARHLQRFLESPRDRALRGSAPEHPIGKADVAHAA